MFWYGRQNFMPYKFGLVSFHVQHCIFSWNVTTKNEVQIQPLEGWPVFSHHLEELPTKCFIHNEKDKKQKTQGWQYTKIY